MYGPSATASQEVGAHSNNLGSDVHPCPAHASCAYEHRVLAWMALESRIQSTDMKAYPAPGLFDLVCWGMDAM